MSDALDTLERVGRGGEHVLAAAHDRIVAAQHALAEGRFDDAEDRLGEALGYAGHLAAAERSLARFADDAEVVAAADVEEGMMLLGWGTVEDVEEVASHGKRYLRFTCRNVHDKEQHPLMPLDARLVVEREEAGE